MEFQFRQKLKQEFQTRKKTNPRYSLRAFAKFLGADHSVLSQILRGLRRIPSRQIRSWGKKLKLTPEEAAAYVAAEYLPDAATTTRHQQLRHWVAESLSVATKRTHWDIVRLSRLPRFQTDCRWIAEKSNTTVDEVNLALQRLLRLQLLEVSASGKWKDLTGARNEREFRKIALIRVREKAAEAKVDLRNPEK